MRPTSLLSTTLAALALTVVATTPAAAQRVTNTAPTPVYGNGFELRPFAGGLISTGAQRDLLKDTGILGAQLGWRMTPMLSLTGSFGWAPTKDRTTTTGSGGLRTGREENVDLYQYDLGLEARMPRAMTAGNWNFAPYIGLGGGGRTYNYRDISSIDAQTNFVGYGSLGVDVAPQAAPIGLRFEVRDNISAFKGLRGEYADAKARNDVQLHAGLAWRF